MSFRGPNQLNSTFNKNFVSKNIMSANSSKKKLNQSASAPRIPTNFRTQEIKKQPTHPADQSPLLVKGILTNETPDFESNKKNQGLEEIKSANEISTPGNENS